VVKHWISIILLSSIINNIKVEVREIMIMFKDLFLELFNDTYDYELASKNSDERMYSFFDEDKNRFDVSFSQIDLEDLEETYGIDVYDVPEGIGYEITFWKNNSLEQSDTKNPFKVFSTILDIVKKNKSLLRKGNFVLFSATHDEKSRVSLYKKMLKPIQKIIGFQKSQTVKGFFDTFYIIYD
jgi:hypothetical protein